MPKETLYIDMVRELIEVRDGRKVIAGLDRTELLDLLECLGEGWGGVGRGEGWQGLGGGGVARGGEG